MLWIFLCVSGTLSAQNRPVDMRFFKTGTLACSEVTSVDILLCEGENYQGYSTAGVYVDHFTTNDGCDSTRTLHLSVNGTKTNSIKASICSGSEYQGYTENGVYTDHYRTPGGCDSVRTLILDVVSPPKPDLGKDFVFMQRIESRHYSGQFRFLPLAERDTGSSFTVLRPDTYTVQVVNGCGTASASVHISYSKCQVVFPTAFTPNGDGLNERFRALHADNVQGFSLSIYSRYGGLVYQTSNASAGWDGKLNGKFVSSSSYVWVCRYQEGGQWVSEKGSVVLIR